MVYLEKTLAEIEVLASEVTHGHVLIPYTNIEKALELEKAITGVENDARLAFNQCRETYLSLRKKNDLSASSAFSEMALDLKNLADNLNIALQITYGNYTGNLKALEQNTAKAPLTSEGKSLYKRFIETHDSSKASPLMMARNSKGHNNGHNILFRTPTDPGWPKDTPYFLSLPREKPLGTDTRFLREGDIESLASDYLEMARDILQTVADNDPIGLAERRKTRGLNTQVKRAKNFFKRHSKPLAIAAASILLTAGAVGGSIGTITYQNYQRQKEMQETLRNVDFIFDKESGFKNNIENWERKWSDKLKEDLIEKRRSELQKLMVEHPEYSPCYNLKKIFGTSSNLFDKTIGKLDSDSKRLGIYLDNYFLKVPAEKKDLPSKTAKFLESRKSFIERESHFSESQMGKIPTYESLNVLNELVHEQEKLSDVELNIISFFPRLK